MSKSLQPDEPDALDVEALSHDKSAQHRTSTASNRSYLLHLFFAFLFAQNI